MDKQLHLGQRDTKAGGEEALFFYVTWQNRLNEEELPTEKENSPFPKKAPFILQILQLFILAKLPTRLCLGLLPYQ